MKWKHKEENNTNHCLSCLVARFLPLILNLSLETSHISYAQPWLVPIMIHVLRRAWWTPSMNFVGLLILQDVDAPFNYYIYLIIETWKVRICLFIDLLQQVSCKIINVRSGVELPEKCRELALHFQTQGTPVMIGQYCQNYLFLILICTIGFTSWEGPCTDSLQYGIILILLRVDGQ